MWLTYNLNTSVVARTPQSVHRSNPILTLVLFFLSNLAVILPIRVPIPRVVTNQVVKLLNVSKVISSSVTPAERKFIWFNFLTVPLLSVFVLLATGGINGEVIRKGILGADGVQPISVLALFISLAYISISLDVTGLLRFSAFWVACKGGPSGRRLFLYLYIFFLFCGVIVGNDPVILSGTAFLAYFTRVAGITPPTAWIFSQFAAANMASVVLVPSNPTNLVLSGAFSISFIDYTAHVILPFLAAAFVVLPTLTACFFRSQTLVPKTIDFDPAEVRDRNAALVDKKGAIFGSILLVLTLGVLVGTSTIGVSVWEVTVPAALIMLVRDVHHDWTCYTGPREVLQSATYSLGPVHDTSTGGDGPHRRPVHKSPKEDSKTRTEPPLPWDLVSYLKRHLYPLSSRFPTTTTVLKRLPISLLPFAFLMFILVQGLSAQGWVEVFAGWWTIWVNKTGTIGAVGGMGFISCMLCNVCGTNIGATILIARVLQIWISDADTLDPRTRDGAIYALAIGSNYGAFTLTFSASLAGLLWRQILQQKGIRVRRSQFLLLNLPIAFAAMLSSCGVLVAQVYIAHRDSK